MWACCLGLYGSDPACQVGICGLPEDLKKDLIDPAQDHVALVEQHFMNNQVAAQKIRKFMETYKTSSATSSLVNITGMPTPASMQSLSHKK